jgi:hypothetical protein
MATHQCVCRTSDIVKTDAEVVFAKEASVTLLSIDAILSILEKIVQNKKSSFL